MRYETNRNFTGMGHERYTVGTPIYGERPVDALAQELFDTSQVAEVHVYAQTISVKLAAGANASGLKSLIENFYIYYKPGVEVPSADSFGG